MIRSLSYSVSALCLFASLAQGALFTYSGILSGANEVPAVNSPGTGTATVTYDDVLNTLRVQAVFSGLTGNTTAAHLHGPAAPGTNAGVMTTTPSFVGFPQGVTSGSMDQTYDLTLASTYRAGFITGQGSLANARTVLLNSLANGQVYFNIHTTTFGGGELRANLTLVPEPSTFGLGALTLAALAFARKRSTR
jgi:hypothetical protein